MKILIADDDNISRMLLKKVVEKEGHTAAVATNGITAWEMICKEAFQLVITDWMMPKLDGISLCRRIREADFPNYIYIILLTAKDHKDDTLEGLQAGVDDYIIKPFNPEELRARIRSGERITGLETQHEQAVNQLIQSEKMASIGQLAAGVAHEINNPTGFVSSNLRTLNDYQKDLSRLIRMYREMLEKCGGESVLADDIQKIREVEEEIDIEYLLDDSTELIGDCLEGTDRIKKIVMDLKDFAHPGEDKKVATDINSGIESTLNVVYNELKYKAEVVKDFGILPPVICFPQQLNQVFMNLFVNAAQAIAEKGTITIVTREENDSVVITVSDTGSGIDAEHLAKIFDPFFTTKEVGKGTGLGLNVAYNIIQKHNGTIEVDSKLGEGTTFTITLPAGK